jgi:hypothetical protein
MSGAYESYEHVTADKIKAGDIISDRLPGRNDEYGL